MPTNLNLILFGLMFILVFGVAIFGFYQWRRRNSALNSEGKLARPLSADYSLSQPAASPVLAPVAQSETAAPILTRLSLGDATHPWGEIVRYERTEADRYEELPLNETTLIGLSSWFQHAPSLALNSANIITNTYTLTFKPEIAKGIADGSLHMMKSLEGGVRAVAVDGQQVIRGVGSLNPATGLQLAAGVTAAWQVLALVTAQKFLADINKQLIKLNKGIEDIKNFLGHQQYATLVGNLTYLNSIRDTLNQQKLDSSEVTVFLNQLEHIDRESGQIMATLRLQMENVLTDFRKQPLDAIFNTQENLLAAEELVAKYEQQARNYLIAASVKGLAAQTRCALPANRTLALERLNTLQTDLSAWYDHQREFYKMIENRLPQLKGWFDSGQKKQERLSQQAKSSEIQLHQAGAQVRELVSQTIQAAQAQLQETSQPLPLLVELNEQGQVTKAWKLLKDN